MVIGFEMVLPGLPAVKWSDGGFVQESTRCPSPLAFSSPVAEVDWVKGCQAAEEGYLCLDSFQIIFAGVNRILFWGWDRGKFMFSYGVSTLR